MADIDDMLLFEDFANLADNSRKSRWFKDRVDLFEYYSDDEFKRRFRLSKLVVERIHEQVKDSLYSSYRIHHTVRVGDSSKRLETRVGLESLFC